MEDGRSRREKLVCPICGGQMILVDIIQRIRVERLTFRCEVCREIVIRDADEPKQRAEH